MIDCTPSAIEESSKCYFGLNAREANAASVYSLCFWANHLTPPPCIVTWSPPNMTLTWNDSGGAHFGDLAAFTSTADYASVTLMEFSGLGLLSDISGLECLPILNTLRLTTQSITSLDVHGLTSLVTLECFDNPLTTLDVSNCTSLVNLDCTSNPFMTSVDAHGCSSISILDLNTGMGALVAVNLSGCSSMTAMNCSANPSLVTMNITGCSSLSNLACAGCALTTLNLSGFSSLTILNCSSNASLTTLTLTGCTALVTLDCNSCALTSLVCTSLTSLATLNCSSNSLTALTLTGCSSLSDLNCNQNPGITSLTLTGLTALVNLDFSFCTLITIDLTPCINLSTIDGSNNNLTGDAIVGFAGCTVLTSLSLSSNPLLTKLVAPASATITTFLAFGCGLTEVDLGTSSSYTLVDLHNNALPATPGGIDRVLSDLKNQDLLNAGTCDLTGGTNAPPTISCATPGSDCFVLINTGGWTISTN